MIQFSRCPTFTPILSTKHLHDLNTNFEQEPPHRAVPARSAGSAGCQNLVYHITVDYIISYHIIACYVTVTMYCITLYHIVRYVSHIIVCHSGVPGGALGPGQEGAGFQGAEHYFLLFHVRPVVFAVSLFIVSFHVGFYSSFSCVLFRFLFVSKSTFFVFVNSCY